MNAYLLRALMHFHEFCVYYHVRPLGWKRLNDVIGAGDTSDKAITTAIDACRMAGDKDGERLALLLATMSIHHRNNLRQRLNMYREAWTIGVFRDDFNWQLIDDAFNAELKAPGSVAVALSTHQCSAVVN